MPLRDPAGRLRARLLRLDTRHLIASRHGVVHTRRCGTWDHYLTHPEPFLTGLRQTSGGSGQRRFLLAERERDSNPADRLDLARGPLVRCHALIRQRRRSLARTFPDLFDPPE